MISSYKDYKEYLKADKKANHINSIWKSINSVNWQFLKVLRKCEYINNCISNNYKIGG
jgi:hypothetical protein